MSHKSLTDQIRYSKNFKILSKGLLNTSVSKNILLTIISYAGLCDHWIKIAAGADFCIPVSHS